MAKVKGKNTTPEMLVRKALFAPGFRFRLHRKNLPGCPDIVLPRHKVVVFVTGAFGMRAKGARGQSYRARGKSFGATSRCVMPRAMRPLCSRCTIKGGGSWWFGNAHCEESTASKAYQLPFQTGWIVATSMEKSTETPRTWPHRVCAVSPGALCLTLRGPFRVPVAWSARCRPGCAPRFCIASPCRLSRASTRARSQAFAPSVPAGQWPG